MLIFAGDKDGVKLNERAKVRSEGGWAFVYIGPGHCPTIPARNLTHKEAVAFGRELIRSIRNPHYGGPLYKEML